MSQLERRGLSTLTRDPATIALYLILGTLGFLLNGLGAVLGPLGRQLSVSRAEVAFYPSLFAAALVVVGLVGGSLTRWIGQRRILRLALTALALGAILLGTPLRWLTLVGAAVIGCGGALIVQSVPAILTQRHPGVAASAIGEANAVSSLASIMAPAAVALAAASDLDWRVGYVVPVIPVIAVLLILVSVLPSDQTTAPVPDRTTVDGPGQASDLARQPLLGRWVAVLLAVGAEFCLVFWASEALGSWHGASSSAAPALAALFLLGMALSRSAAATLTTGRDPLSVVLGGCAVAGAGFLLFWGTPHLLGSAAGLLIVGAGIGLLYPVTLARLVAAWPAERARASALGALASGLAIGVPPMVLARMADLVGLRAAYLLVPALLGLLAGQAGVTRLRGHRPGRSGPGGESRSTVTLARPGSRPCGPR